MTFYSFNAYQNGCYRTFPQFQTLPYFSCPTIPKAEQQGQVFTTMAPTSQENFESFTFLSAVIKIPDDKNLRQIKFIFPQSSRWGKSHGGRSLRQLVTLCLQSGKGLSAVAQLALSFSFSLGPQCMGCCYCYFDRVGLPTLVNQGNPSQTCPEAQLFSAPHLVKLTINTKRQ